MSGTIDFTWIRFQLTIVWKTNTVRVLNYLKFFLLWKLTNKFLQTEKEGRSWSWKESIMHNNQSVIFTRVEDKVIFAPGKIRKKHNEENLSEMKRPESVDRFSNSSLVMNIIMILDFRIKSNQNPRETKSRESKRPASMARKKDENVEKRNWEEKLYEVWNNHHIPSFHRWIIIIPSLMH